ncbi:MAG: tetratricopeptide repeat protein [Polyangiales bacterium]|nr:tetratricopeptide repeat protein [Myxococcales bacterium]MCB9659987.1 tetratricopeptide repeat protein [Sandaracinaceae bacterium]
MGVVRMGLMAVMLCATTVGWGLAPSVASAQNSADEEARALFEAGRLAFSRGRYEQALGHFQEAYELSHRSALLYNIGTTHDRLRQDQQAIDAFEQFLEAEPDSDLVPEVQERVRILRENQRPDLSPEAVAAASDPSSDPSSPAAPSERDNRIVKKWWFWTIIGVVVVGAAVGIGVGASGGGGQQGALPYDANTITVEL